MAVLTSSDNAKRGEFGVEKDETFYFEKGELKTASGRTFDSLGELKSRDTVDARVLGLSKEEKKTWGERTQEELQRWFLKKLSLVYAGFSWVQEFLVTRHGYHAIKEKLIQCKNKPSNSVDKVLGFLHKPYVGFFEKDGVRYGSTGGLSRYLGVYWNTIASSCWSGDDEAVGRDKGSGLRVIR